MRASLPADALDALCARCRTTPTLEALRDLVDRPDPAVQTLLAEPWLRAVFGDANPNVRRRALRVVMAREVPTAWDRIDAATAAATGDVPRLRDLLHIVGRDADRRFAFERKGFRDHDARWITLARSYARSRDRELCADAEYALLGAPVDLASRARGCRQGS